MADKRLEIQLEIQELRETISRLEEAVKVTDKGTGANKEHGKSVLELVEHTRGFHRVLHQITEQSPLLGLALHTAFSGPGAAVAALLFAIHALKQLMEEAKKEAEEHARKVGEAFTAHEDSVSKWIDEIHKAKVGHDDWVKSLTDGSHKIRQELDLNIEKFHAVVAAQKEVIESAGGTAKEMPGSVQAEELRLTQEAIAKLTKQRDEAMRAVTSAEAAAMGGDRGVKADEAERLSKQLTAQAEKVTTEGGKLSFMDRIGGGMLRRALPGTLETRLVEAESAREEARKQADIAAQFRAEQERLNKAMEDSRKKAKEYSDQLEELQRKAESLKATSSIASMGGAMAGSVDDPIAKTLAGGAAALAFQPRIGHGASPSGLYQNQMEALLKMLRALHEESMLPLIQANSENIEGLAKIADQLRQRQQQLAAQLKNTHAP